jgi:uncharacterized protein YdeI (YjbR/CyaY-like superfamily)
MNPKVDEFLGTSGKWQQEMELLRTIILECDLEEDFKWGKPCYSSRGSTLVLIMAFKEYCALGFYRGALLSDPAHILVKPGENSQSMRQIRFTTSREIDEMKPLMKAYIFEAVELEKSGLKVEFTEKKNLIFPEEFQKKLDELPALKTAFNSLTPGRQRAYNLYFSAPRQSKTRESRIEKCIPPILNGKGLETI